MSDTTTTDQTDTIDFEEAPTPPSGRHAQTSFYAWNILSALDETDVIKDIAAIFITAHNMLDPKLFPSFGEQLTEAEATLREFAASPPEGTPKYSEGALNVGIYRGRDVVGGGRRVSFKHSTEAEEIAKINAGIAKRRKAAQKRRQNEIAQSRTDRANSLMVAHQQSTTSTDTPKTTPTRKSSSKSTGSSVAKRGASKKPASSSESKSTPPRKAPSTTRRTATKEPAADKA